MAASAALPAWSSQSVDDGTAYYAATATAPAAAPDPSTGWQVAPERAAEGAPVRRIGRFGDPQRLLSLIAAAETMGRVATLPPLMAGILRQLAAGDAPLPLRRAANELLHAIRSAARGELMRTADDDDEPRWVVPAIADAWTRTAAHVIALMRRRDGGRWQPWLWGGAPVHGAFVLALPTAPAPALAADLAAHPRCLGATTLTDELDRHSAD